MASEPEVAKYSVAQLEEDVKDKLSLDEEEAAENADKMLTNPNKKKRKRKSKKNGNSNTKFLFFRCSNVC